MDFTNKFTELINDRILTESFQSSSMSRVLDLVGKYLTKSFGSQARWMDNSELEVITIAGVKLYGISYYFANGSELRVGFKTISGGSFSITRLDYWKPGFTRAKINTTGVAIADYSVTFDTDLSVMQMFPKVLPVIKNILTTKTGAKSYDILMVGPKSESLTEAAFTGSKSQIVRDMLKAGKSKAEIYATIGDDASAKSLVSKIGKALGIVVTAKVTPAGNKGETVSASTVSSLKKSYKLIPRYSDEKYIYDDLNLLLNAVVTKKKFNALLVTGSTGTGKTQNILNYLKEAGLKGTDRSDGGEADYSIIKGGSVSAFALYNNLFAYREKGKILLIDDADAAFDSPEKSNIFKAVLDSYDERTVSWETKNPKIFNVTGKQLIKEGSDEWDIEIEDGKLPNKFAYRGQIIIISNKHISEFEPALIGRCVAIDITIKSSDMVNRIESMLASGKSIGGFDAKSGAAALKFMKTLTGLKTDAGEYWPGTSYSKEDYMMIKDEGDMNINFRTFMTISKFFDLGFSEEISKRLCTKYANIPAKLLANSAGEQPEE